MQKQNPNKNSKLAIASLIITLVVISSFINSAAAETTPPYAFNDAYATYKATASSGFGLSVDGTITYTVSNVDSNAQTFTLTPSYGGQLSILGSVASSQKMSYSDFLVFAVPPAYMQDLNKGEASGLQYSYGTITTDVSVTVPAGTYTTDKVDYGAYSLWVDQGSGLVVKISGTYLGLSSADIELQSTNISSISSQSTQLLIVAAVVVVIVVVVVVVVLLKKRKPKQNAVNSATDTTATSPAATTPSA